MIRYNHVNTYIGLRFVFSAFSQSYLSNDAASWFKQCVYVPQSDTVTLFRQNTYMQCNQCKLISEKGTNIHDTD